MHLRRNQLIRTIVTGTITSCTQVVAMSWSSNGYRLFQVSIPVLEYQVPIRIESNERPSIGAVSHCPVLLFDQFAAVPIFILRKVKNKCRNQQDTPAGQSRSRIHYLM